MGLTMPIRVGGLNFKSKEQCKRYIRSMISKYKDEEAFDSFDILFVLDLLNGHKERDEKIGKGVESVVARSLRGSRGMWLKRKDGSEIAFSFYNCFQKGELDA